MNPNDVLTITMRESGPLCRLVFDAEDGRRQSREVTVEEVRRLLAQAETQRLVWVLQRAGADSQR